MLCVEELLVRSMKFWKGWRTKNVSLPYECGLWRNILKWWEEFNEYRFQGG